MILRERHPGTLHCKMGSSESSQVEPPLKQHTLGLFLPNLPKFDDDRTLVFHLVYHHQYPLYIFITIDTIAHCNWPDSKILYHRRITILTMRVYVQTVFFGYD